MLRIAVPNKGALSEGARSMLHDAGYLQSSHPRDLVVRDPENDAEFFFLRPRDIATYVGSGRLDLGITGRDMLADSGSDARELLDLGFGRSTFRLAAPAGTVTAVTELANRRIATSYAGVLAGWLETNDLTAQVVELDGAVENAVRLGVADAVADVVDTGTTMKQAGLEFVGPVLLESVAVLIGPAEGEQSSAAATLIRRIQGVMLARSYVLVDYDIRNEKLDEASAVTPGLESPTISPLRDEKWVAVRAMVPRSDAHRVMDELYAIGARGILVTAIHACRL
ncbi:MAG: ATP phosphoribosyltransferase [Candidatus Nanopelagicales bacterium]|nr:ATP phosphoribosyltransferase [Candidatus Nanopelagicales bacterium]